MHATVSDFSGNDNDTHKPAFPLVLPTRTISKDHSKIDNYSIAQEFYGC